MDKMNFNSESDRKFLVHIIVEICNYAVNNNMVPDDTLSAIAEAIILYLEVATCNGWSE